MPRSWNEKDDRQYEHVFETGRRRGMSEKRARAYAARAVNRQRRMDGGREPAAEAPTPSAGEATTPLERRSKRELYRRAKELGIEGRSALSKADLVRAIRMRES